MVDWYIMYVHDAWLVDHRWYLNGEITGGALIGDHR